MTRDVPIHDPANIFALAPKHVSAIIVGAQKAGTTSLLRYLAQHPRLCGHEIQEFSFFEDDGQYRRGWDWARARYFYNHLPGQQLIAKHASLSQSEVGLARLAQHSPRCRVVLVLRDPVDRAFSSYRMERNAGWVVRPFEHILTCLDPRSHDVWKGLFVDFGDYRAALSRVYNHFAPHQVTVLVYEEFVSSPVSACQQLFGQLGVEDGFVPDTSAVHNAHQHVKSQAAASGLRWLREPSNPIRRAARRVLPTKTFDRVGKRLVEANHGLYSEEAIDPEVREALGLYYRPLNEQLQELLGRDLSLWTGMGAATPPAELGAQASRTTYSNAP